MMNRSQESEVRSQSNWLWIGGYCALPLAVIVLALAVSVRMLQRPARSSARSLGRHEAPGQVQAADRKYDLSPIIAIAACLRKAAVARGHLTEDTTYYTGMDGRPVRRQESGVRRDLAALFEQGSGEVQYLLPAVPRQGRFGAGNRSRFTCPPGSRRI